MKNRNLRNSTGIQKRMNPLIYYNRLGGPFFKAHPVRTSRAALVLLEAKNLEFSHLGTRRCPKNILKYTGLDCVVNLNILTRQFQ